MYICEAYAGTSGFNSTTRIITQNLPLKMGCHTRIKLHKMQILLDLN